MKGNMTETKSLHAKLAEIMSAVGYIPKTGDGPGYRFAAATVVADKVRDELASRKVTFTPVRIDVLTPPDLKTISEKQRLISLLVTWRFTDAESGETHDIVSIGTGADQTDKAAPKAQTNALKYAFLMAFAIPTGDDPEAAPAEAQEISRSAVSGTAVRVEQPSGKITDGQRTKLLTKAKEKGLNEAMIKAALAITAQVASSKDLTPPQFEALLAQLDQTSFIASLKEVKSVGAPA